MNYPQSLLKDVLIGLTSTDSLLPTLTSETIVPSICLTQTLQYISTRIEGSPPISTPSGRYFVQYSTVLRSVSDFQSFLAYVRWPYLSVSSESDISRVRQLLQPAVGWEGILKHLSCLLTADGGQTLSHRPLQRRYLRHTETRLLESFLILLREFSTLIFGHLPLTSADNRSKHDWIKDLWCHSSHIADLTQSGCRCKGELEWRNATDLWQQEDVDHVLICYPECPLQSTLRDSFATNYSWLHTHIEQQLISFSPHTYSLVAIGPPLHSVLSLLLLLLYCSHSSLFITICCSLLMHATSSPFSS